MFGLLTCQCPGQVRDVLCSDGSGTFEENFRTGVKVSIGPQRQGELARRVCQATMAWGKHKLVVAPEAAQIDLDLYGADMDTSGPVAGFQIRKSRDECCMTYQIYSLETPPRLVRTIAGGEFFRAADTDLDGRVEIWTDDAAAVNGFENLSPAEIEFLPTCVLRMEHGRLLDVSAEFTAHFDEVIAKVRAQIVPERIQEFQASDGALRLAATLPAEELSRLHTLRKTKIKVLEIVWAYLYSGRETEAWRSLDKMWPKGDLERIQTAILSARSHGIRAQVDDVSTAVAVPKKKVRIFEENEVAPPRAILMRSYPPAGVPADRLPKSQVHLAMVIDCAGKVQSVESSIHSQWVDEYVRGSTGEWKFVPAFRAGHAVASRFKLNVWLMR